MGLKIFLGIIALLFCVASVRGSYVEARKTIRKKRPEPCQIITVIFTMLWSAFLALLLLTIIPVPERLFKIWLFILLAVAGYCTIGVVLFLIFKLIKVSLDDEFMTVLNSIAAGILAFVWFFGFVAAPILVVIYFFSSIFFSKR